MMSRFLPLGSPSLDLAYRTLQQSIKHLTRATVAQSRDSADKEKRMRGALARRARHWIANRGWAGFLVEVRRRLLLTLRGNKAPGSRTPPVTEHPFDRRHGVETGGLIFGEHLDATNDSAYWATAYYGIAPSVLIAALERLSLPWERYTFVDIGSGKGRALMIAMRFPLKEVVGLELSPELAAVGKRNLERFTAAQRSTVQSRVLCGDAAQADLPDGPLILSIYHPFAAPVMRAFLARVGASLQSHPRRIWILYFNPELHPMLKASPWLEVAWDECLPMSAEDRAADRFGSEWERVVAYCSLEAAT